MLVMLMLFLVVKCRLVSGFCVVLWIGLLRCLIQVVWVLFVMWLVWVGLVMMD